MKRYLGQNALKLYSHFHFSFHFQLILRGSPSANAGLQGPLLNVQYKIRKNSESIIIYKYVCERRKKAATPLSRNRYQFGFARFCLFQC